MSLEVSPLLAYNTASTISAAKDIRPSQHAQPFHQDPSAQKKASLRSRKRSLLAALKRHASVLSQAVCGCSGTFLRGIERRIDSGLKPDVGSVASVFISRWDVAVMGKVPDTLRGQLGIAIAKRTYKAYRALLSSPRGNAYRTPGHVPNGCCGPAREPRTQRRPIFFTLKALAAPFTVNTMPESTLKALADHSELDEILTPDGGNGEEVLAQLVKQASTPTHWPNSSKTRAQGDLPNPGEISRRSSHRNVMFFER